MKYLMPCVAILLAISVTGCDAGAGSEVTTNVLVPQKGSGAPYGSRDLWTCSSKADPKSGGISAGMATQYALCSFDHIDDAGFAYLADKVKLEVGKGVVPTGMHIGKWGEDPSAKVYALRGSYDWYQCTKEDKGAPAGPGIWGSFQQRDSNIGKNCSVMHEVNATGNCARTTFGDWKCTLDMGGNGMVTVRNVPPPKH